MTVANNLIMYYNLNVIFGSSIYNEVKNIVGPDQMIMYLCVKFLNNSPMRENHQ